MRLLALTTCFPLHSNASAGVFVRRLYENLPEPWSVDVVCPDDRLVSAIETAEDSGGRLRPVRYAPRRWQVLAQQSGGIAASLRQSPWRMALVPALMSVLWWRCVIAGRHADVLHANWAVCGAIAASAASLSPLPIVTTFRGDDVTRAERSTLDRWLLDAAVRGSAALVCVSEAMAAQLRARYPSRADDIFVCLNGVDAAFLMVVRSPPEPRRLRIAAVGSLIRRKGYDVLIEAIARARCRGAIRLRIAGAGPELSALREHADRLGVGDRIEFVGELAPTRVPQFLADSDLFVLPSRSEGRPNVLVEALAAGLPVVSSDLPGVDGLVKAGINGWRVAVGDIAGFAMALDEACEDVQDREARAAAARAGMLSDGHHWAATGARYDALFRQVLEKTIGGRT